MAALKGKLSEKGLYNVILVLVLAAFLLLNGLFAALQSRLPLRLDLTGERLYELGAVTKDTVSALKNETAINVISGVESFPPAFNEMLSRYPLLGANISLNYIDPYKNPLFLDSRRKGGLTLAEGDILVEGERSKLIKSEDMLVYENGEPTGIALEQQVTSAIIYANSKEELKAAFMVGHNERITESLRKLFSSNNFILENISLDRDTLSEHRIAVIAAPTVDYTPDETEKLKAYLKSGGSVMAFLEPGGAELRNLSALLADWNLSVKGSVVLEEKNYAAGNPLNIIPVYAGHPINKYFETNQLYMLAPASSPLEVLNTRASLKTEAVLYSSPSSYEKTGGALPDTKKAPDDNTGPFALAATSEDEDGGRVFLMGSRSVFADDIMNMPSYANSAFFGETLNYLYSGVKAVSIPPKTMSRPPLAITFGSSALLGLLFILVFPAVALGLGIYTYVKRRSL